MGYLLGFGIPLSYIIIGLYTSAIAFRRGVNSDIREGFRPDLARKRNEGEPAVILSGIFWPLVPLVILLFMSWDYLFKPLYDKPTKAEVDYNEKQAVEAAKEVVYGKDPAHQYYNHGKGTYVEGKVLVGGEYIDTW